MLRIIRMVRKSCSICESDLSTLKSTIVPVGEASWSNLTIAVLFSGCGGLSLGIQRAAHDFGFSLDVRLAVDSDPIALSVYRKLFPTSRALCSPLEQILDGDIGSPHTVSEIVHRASDGSTRCVARGTTLQGHSNLNNHSRRDDPRNGLYLRMARAAEVLSPLAIIVENVPTSPMTFGEPSIRPLIDSKRLVTLLARVSLTYRIWVYHRSAGGVIVAVRDCDIDPQRLIDKLKSPMCGLVPKCPLGHRRLRRCAQDHPI